MREGRNADMSCPTTFCRHIGAIHQDWTGKLRSPLSLPIDYLLRCQLSSMKRKSGMIPEPRCET